MRDKIDGKLIGGRENQKRGKGRSKSGAEGEKCCQTRPKNTKSMRYEPRPSPPVLKALKPKGRRKLWMHGLETLLHLLWKELN